MSKNGVCKQHGKSVTRRVKWNHDENRYAGDYYACPDYHECGQYYCTKTGVMKTSKKFG